MESKLYMRVLINLCMRLLGSFMEGDKVFMEADKVCVCVYTHMCVCVCMCVCTFIFLRESESVCVCVCV